MSIVPSQDVTSGDALADFKPRTTRPRTAFFSLPVEIRMEIYRYLFCAPRDDGRIRYFAIPSGPATRNGQGPSLICTPLSCAFCQALRKKKSLAMVVQSGRHICRVSAAEEQALGQGRRIFYRKGGKFHPEILRVCRSIYTEACIVLYTSLHLEIHTGSAGTPPGLALALLQAFAGPVSAVNRARVRRLTLLILSMWSAPGDVRMLARVIPSKFSGLQDVVLAIQWAPPGCGGVATGTVAGPVWNGNLGYVQAVAPRWYRRPATKQTVQGLFSALAPLLGFNKERRRGWARLLRILALSTRAILLRHEGGVFLVEVADDVGTTVRLTWLWMRAHKKQLERDARRLVQNQDALLQKLESTAELRKVAHEG